ncbi:hypothetical protein JZ751_001964 [Albula glossodonta]|uniref:Uncharacterized protein n=1 Tax=Albula glossodonta TaxID=121402 RepID=A0A8T2P7K7_9TELE|nr:hypothetical protein JZ751_001964 [Albula glossodonta]
MSFGNLWSGFSVFSPLPQSKRTLSRPFSDLPSPQDSPGCNAQYGWASNILFKETVPGHLGVSLRDGRLVLDEFGHVKFCSDASQPDIGSWLKHVQFAPLAHQHNLIACQREDKVCGERCTGVSGGHSTPSCPRSLLC